jgi:hypothetical protein
MTARALGRLTGLVVLGWITGSAGSAQAFCRATTIEGKVDSCYECETMGYPLAWPQPDIEYTSTSAAFTTVSDDDVRAIFSEAIDQWQAVTCEGQPVEIDVHPASDTNLARAARRRRRAEGQRHRLPERLEWEEEDFDPRAFAQTGVRYYKDSGVIAGADIWFNGGIGEFGVCPARGLHR